VSVGSGGFQLNDKIGKVVSVGAGNVVSVGAGNVVSVGSGGLIAQLGGNVVSVGAGNFDPAHPHLVQPVNLLKGGGGHSMVLSSLDPRVVSVGSGGKLVAARKNKALVLATGHVKKKKGGLVMMKVRFTKKGLTALHKLGKKPAKARGFKFKLTSTFKPRHGRRVTVRRSGLVKG
jgi:hypothetical protein